MKAKLNLPLQLVLEQNASVLLLLTWLNRLLRGC